MKKNLLCSIFLISVFASMHAQTKKESIKELFAVMHQDSLVIKSFDMMTSSMLTSMNSLNADTTFSTGANEIMKASMQKSRDVSLKIINEDMVDIYDKYFDQKEINDFITFYKSKSGQHWISITPDIQKDLMSVMMFKYMPTLRQDMTKELEELHKKRAEPK